MRVRSNAESVEGAWVFVVAGAELEPTKRLTGVSIQTLERMRAAVRKLAKLAPECPPAQMKWKEAMRVAERTKAAPITDQNHKAPSNQPELVSALADILAMLDAGLPDAIMNAWARQQRTARSAPR